MERKWTIIAQNIVASVGVLVYVLCANEFALRVRAINGLFEIILYHLALLRIFPLVRLNRTPMCNAVLRSDKGNEGPLLALT